ncbi:13977_t:CDS:2 [Cetraspora pellucida]|uniref:13977_t:CDS:1 n=1 Tax=Cetraspora pellucida TaxID=1433469 RepID=A0ACA9K1X4_9GLOM|nr:13977_t:CDS:2 [Cetraspora pellucida]
MYCSDLTDENIKQFIAGKVWGQKLSKYLEASDFSEFKKSQSSLKSLENFIAESLKIYVDYQIALDQLTLHITIPSTSQRNCANELDFNQIDAESSDNE